MDPIIFTTFIVIFLLFNAVDNYNITEIDSGVKLVRKGRKSGKVIGLMDYI